MRVLDDNNKMPWGKHQGKRLMDIPASYFQFIWNNGKKHETATCPVAAYILKSMAALKTENKDLIWDEPIKE